ncbi:MAG: TIGR02646 family protein [Leptolyngbya sp. UWPOB_LEPTO1]|uniref:retron system putative HNH endonuclease n=1 Tax=Leptolyngbya sp. UWPOB_LEPTO1 TaxID=2815653 RepID=UPI001AD5996E|nr:retron system putative HNH endonuclease [Leptolyngbya sp. UWPOB_LEPTO1]MBN8559467.1 TIGR02646 family protein [Leptolyngbya sp. UWPOB_LEPTO1]
MRYIQKNQEPSSLTQYRKAADPKSKTVFDDYPDKEPLRQSLLKEQGYLCCYCLRRVTGSLDPLTGKPDTRIEHWSPQSIYNGEKGKADLRLSYRNLLAACHGNEDSESKDYHCDVLKGNQEIILNPTQKNCETKIYYSTSGEICSKNPQIQQELGTVTSKGILNLNSQTFRENRSAALMATIDKLKQQAPTGNWSSAILKKAIQTVSQRHNNAHLEYFPYVVFHLEKRLSRAKIP